MIIPKQIPIYGDSEYRGECPIESAEQITFVNTIRREYPDTYGLTLVHNKNEGKRKGKQFDQLKKDKLMGFSTGSPDIQIPGSPSLCMELKRRDHTLCKISKEQVDYLLAAKEQGAFISVAFGYDGAMQAFNEWIQTNKNK